MKNEKLIPSFITEDKSFLPQRGGRYVSDEEKEKAEHEQTTIELRKLRECNCNCDCNCYWNCNNCDDHPFHAGEGSC